MSAVDDFVADLITREMARRAAVLELLTEEMLTHPVAPGIVEHVGEDGTWNADLTLRVPFGQHHIHQQLTISDICVACGKWDA